MDDRQKTLAALTVIFGFIIFVIIIIGSFISGQKVISPVPGDSSIKIIFLTPTPVPRETVIDTPPSETDINNSL